MAFGASFIAGSVCYRKDAHNAQMTIHAQLVKLASHFKADESSSRNAIWMKLMGLWLGPGAWNMGKRSQLVEAGALHASLSLNVLHKCLPNKACAQIFGHQEDNARIDPDHVGVVPVF